jgi:hypothetical protein
MKTGKKVAQRLGMAKKNLRELHKRLGGAGKGLLAALTGTAIIMGSAGKTVKSKTAGLKNSAFHYNNKKYGEDITVKKSTVVAIFVALAAVAGVLAALYFYVLRREKELDEYEQLLFSEDFSDDLPEEDEGEPVPEKTED